MFAPNAFRRWLKSLRSPRAGRRPRPTFDFLEDRVVPATVFAIGSANQLYRFDSAMPGTLTTIATVNVTAGDTLQGIDFRPATGQLFGLATNAAATVAHLYTIDITTATATQVGGDIALPQSSSPSTPVATSLFGFDFNPTVDRIRVVSEQGDNFRLNPNNGSVAGADTGLNSGGVLDLGIAGAAYDRNAGNNTLTTLYGLDHLSETLIRIGGVDGSPSPNLGATTTIGTVMVGGAAIDFSQFVGFDIDGASTTTGLASFVDVNNGLLTRFYSINLSTAAATLVGNIGNGLTTIFDIAVQQTGLYIAGGAGVNDTLVVTATGTASGTYSLNGGAAVPFSDITSFTFNGNTGDDRLVINNPAGGLFAPAGGIFYNGQGQTASDSLQNLGGAATSGTYTPSGVGTGSGTLTHTGGGVTQTITFTGLEPVDDTVTETDFVINGTANADAISITNTTVGATNAYRVSEAAANFELINFANKTNVTVAAGNGADTVLANTTVAAAGLAQLTLDLQATDGGTVNIQSTPPSVTTRVSNSASAVETVNVGAVTNLLANILGPVSVTNGSGARVVTLNVSDTANGAARTIDMTSTQITSAGIGTISYTQNPLAALTYNGGTGGNTINVNNTPASGLGTTTTTINSGDSAANGDTVNIQATSTTGNEVVVVNGQQGNDVFNVSSDAPTNAGDLAGLGATLTINGGGNNLNPATTTNVQCSDGNANNAISPVGDTINFSDAGTVAGQTFTLTATTLARSGIPTITYGTVETVNLTTGTGADVVNITSTVNPGTTTINSAGGGDTITTTRNGGSVLIINGDDGANTITVNETSGFITIVNAAGGNDTLNLTATPAGLLVNGGDGDDTFNYAAGAIIGNVAVLNGDDNNDTFNLNFALNGVLAAGCLDVNGGANGAGGTDNRDIVAINAPGQRILNFTYLATAGSLDVTGLGGVNNTFHITGAETTRNLGDAANDDRITVIGTANDEDFTVAPTGPNTNVVFKGGNPWDGPAESATPFQDTQLVGVAGAALGGVGPDLDLRGLVNTSGFTLNAGAGINRLYIYGPSSTDALTNGTLDYFGFGAGVLIPQSPVGFDLVNALGNTNFVAITNDRLGAATALVQTNFNAPSLANNTDPNISDPRLIVFTGFEAGIAADGNADVVNTSGRADFETRFNGGRPTPGVDPLNAATFQGDRINFVAPRLDVYSDQAFPPTVSVVTVGGGLGQQPVNYTDFEDVTATAVTVNIFGDNNTPGNVQPDEYIITGTAQNAFNLRINRSDPLRFTGVVNLNVFGGHDETAFGADAQSGSDRIAITPFAAIGNLGTAWEVITIVDGGNEDAGQEDRLAYTGVAGLVDAILIDADASAAGSGRIYDPNKVHLLTVDPSGLAVRFSRTENINANANSGDNDSLTIQTTQGNDTVTFRFDPDHTGDKAGGIATEPTDLLDDDVLLAGHFSVVIDDGPGVVNPADGTTALVGPSADPTNTNAVNDGFKAVTLRTRDGNDTINVNLVAAGGAITDANGGGVGDLPLVNNVRINVVIDAGTAATGNTLNLQGNNGTGDDFLLTPGGDPNSGIASGLAGVGDTYNVSFSGISAINFDGRGGGDFDTVSLDGTGGDDVFTVVGTGNLAGQARVNNGPLLAFANLGNAGSGLSLNGLSGDDDFSVTQFANWMLAFVNVNGGPPSASDTFQLTGTAGDDVLAYTANAVNGGQLDITSGGVLTSYFLNNVETAFVQALGQTTQDTLTATTTNTTIVPGGATGSGTVLPRDMAGQPLLALGFAGVEASTVTGTNAVVQGSDLRDTVTITAAGLLTLTNTAGTNTVDLSAIPGLVLNLLASDDTVTINTSALFANGIAVIGGGQSGQDRVNIVGTAGAEVFNVALAAGTVGGAVGGDVTLLEIERLSIDGAGGADTVNVTEAGNGSGLQNVALIGDGTAALNVTAGNNVNTLTFTPTGLGAGSYTDGAGVSTTYTGFGGGVTVNGGGSNDTLAVVGNDANNAVTATATTITSENGSVLTIGANVDRLAFHLRGGDDRLTLDNTGGLLAFVDGIVYDGGDDRDTLILTGATGADSVYSVGPAAGQGSVVHTGGGATQRVFFNNLDPVIDNVAGTLTVNANNANNAINYGVGGDATRGLVSVDLFETIDFTNKTTLTINALSGRDTIHLNNPNTPTGLTQITVNGGDPTNAGDTLTVNGTAGADLVTVTPTGLDAATIVGAGPVTIAAATVEGLVYNGQGGDDAVTVTGDANANAFVHTPGTTRDSGTMAMDSFLALSYTNLGVNGSITADGQGGADSLTVLDTPTADNITVTFPAQDTINVVVSGAYGVNIPVRSAGVENYFIDSAGNGFDDIFLNTPANATGTVSVFGGGPSDSLHFTADATVAAVTFAPAAALPPGTTTVTGFGTRIDFGQIDEVFYTGNGAETITIVGSAGDNTIRVSGSTNGGPGTRVEAGIMPPMEFTAVVSFTADGAGGSDHLVIDGTAGTDVITVTRTTVAVDLRPVVTYTNFEQMVVNGGTGIDNLNVNNDGGLVALVQGIVYNGGDGRDSLTLAGGTTVDLSTYTPGTNADQGEVVHTLGAETQTVFFNGLEPVFDFVAGPLVVNGTNAANQIDYRVGVIAADGLVSIDGFETIEFSNKTTLTINALAGSDTINLNNPNTPTGLVQITVNGGNGTNQSDRLTVNGTAAADVIDVTPNAVDGATINGAGPVTIVATTIEGLSVNGQNGSDQVRLLTGANNDVITVTPGAAADAGAVAVEGLLGFDFQNIGVAGSFAAIDAGGDDALTVSGNDRQNVFTVAANTGTVTMTSAAITHVPITQNGIDRLRLEGLGGADTFTITGPQPYTAIAIDGGSGDGATSDVVTVVGDGTVINLTLGTSALTLAGGGIANLDVRQAEVLNVTAAAGDVTVSGRAEDDTITVTPLGEDSAQVNRAGLNTDVFLNAVGALTVNGGGGSDTLVVNANQGNNVIGVTPTSVTVDNRQPVDVYAGIANVRVFGLAGSDTFNVTAGAIPYFLDGGDPISLANGDTINIAGSADAVTYLVGPESDEGVFQVGANAPISFDHVEAANVGNGGVPQTGPITVCGTNADDDITFIGIAANTFSISVNAGPAVVFTGPTVANIQGKSGDDDIDIDTQVAGLAVTINVDGGLPVAGSDTVTVTGVPGAADAATFTPATANSGTFTFAGQQPINLVTVEHLIYDGEADNETLTVNTVAGAVNTVRVTPGTTRDAGRVAVDSLLAIDFQTLGFTGTVTIADAEAADVDRLVYDGTAGNDTFTVTNGTLGLTNVAGVHVNVIQANVESLTINSLSGDDTLTVNANAALYTGGIRFEAGDSNTADHAVLNGTAGNDIIALTLDGDGDTVTGIVGGPITLVHTDELTINSLAGDDTLSVTELGNVSDLNDVTFNSGGDANDTFAATGTGDDDVFTTTPLSATSVEISANNLGPVVTVNLAAAATSTFTVNGAAAVGDVVIVRGTNNHDVITIDSPNRTVTVENAAGTTYKIITLGATVEEVTAQGRLGNDTFLVIPAPATATGPGGANGVQVPINLLINVDGGPPSASDALVIAQAGGAALPASDFVVVNRSRRADEGVVRVFRTGAALPDITFTDVEVVSPVLPPAPIGAQLPNLLILGPDNFEQNEFLATASFLGNGATLNATNLAIFPNAQEHRFVVPDQDWFRVVASATGTLDFQVYFRGFNAAGDGSIPGGGNLGLEAYDASGDRIDNVVATFGSNENTPLDANERIRIPVVQGQTYYLRVFGGDAFDAASNVVNGYSLSVVNTPAPVPFDLELDDVIVPGSVANGASTTSFTANAGVLSAVDGFYNGKFVHFLSGNVNGQRAQITNYVGATRTFTLATGVIATPNAGVTFQIESTDTGRNQTDDVLRDNTPTIFLRLDDAIFLHDLPGNPTDDTPPDQVTVIPFRGTGAGAGYRIAIFDEGNTPPQNGTAPQNLVGFATAVPGQEGVYTFTFPNALSDGSHFITARVQIVDPSVPADAINGFGARSQSLEIVVDTAAPPVFFGDPIPTTDGLAAGSDSGVAATTASFSDRVTNVTRPTLFGFAEANSVVRLYSDRNGNGVVDATDLLLGQTVATPLDGTNAFPNGRWEITTTIDLNQDPFTRDGIRSLLVTAEDVAGNVSAPQTLNIFIDTQGPQVTDVRISGFPGFNLFALKPANLLQGPTPLVNGLTISLRDLPARVAEFLFNALNTDIAARLGASDIVVRGDNTGIVAITSITYVNDAPVAGGIATGRILLTFAAPLPDDRYTLTINDDAVLDPAGNRLDGESNAQQPIGTPNFFSGDSLPGGDFIARFTVDSRPEIGTACCGSTYVDLNGNGQFDANGQDNDQTNADKVFRFGLSSDIIFAGRFYNGGVFHGFDSLGAYGFTNGAFRFLLDFNSDGVADLTVVPPVQVNGLPVAGDFAPGRPGDEIGVFDGNGRWFLDTNGDNNLSAADIVINDGLAGFPIAGDFDGNGQFDLATYQPDRDLFTFHLNPLGAPNVIRTFGWGFAGVTERPVAADLDRDGTTDIGLFVPDRAGVLPQNEAEWYFLLSVGTETAGTINTLAHPFQPAPLGNDIFYKFGDARSLPVVGNFDPPPADNGVVAQSAEVGQVYNYLLGREADGLSNAYWTAQIQQGRLSFQGFIATIAGSDEYFARSGGTAQSFVTAVYRDFLGRIPSAGEVASWVGTLASAPRTAVANAIFQSQEALDHPTTWVGQIYGSQANFVKGVYTEVLGRVASDGEAMTFARQMVDGRLSRAGLVAGILGSAEAERRNIDVFYQRHLGRSGDAASLDFWQSVLRRGGRLEDVFVAIVTSAEFLGRNSAGADFGSQVQALYQSTLGRTATAGEIAMWQQNGSSLQTVARAVAFSSEYRGRIVDGYYQNFFGRAAEAGGVAFWVGALNSGWTQEMIQTVLLASDEFYSLSSRR